MSKREEYFRKFPKTVYRGVPSTNILKRVDFNASVRKFFDNFYEYTLTDNDNIQTSAHDYYDEVDLDWMIYLSNDIIDPYFQVPQDDREFKKYIQKKYGSVEAAKKNIFCYKTNYEAYAQEVLSVSGYNALPGERKKYWSPLFSAIGIAGYERDKTDIFISTNRIVSLQFVSEQENVYTVGENIYDKNNTDSRATVSGVSSTSVILKNINGDFEKSTNYTLVGETSGIEIEINFEEYNLIQQVIPVAEEIYFNQYTYYDYEADINESKRNISLVDQFQSNRLNDQLTDILK